MGNEVAGADRLIKGMWTAIVTPFDESGEIDYAGFEKLLKLQESAGVDGVVVSGTTGEAPTLSSEEKLALIKFARGKLKPTVRIMAGTGTNDTKASIELSKKAKAAGADSLLVVTPPYNKPNFRGLMSHYNAIAEAVDLPICLYHVPSRTAQKLTVEELVELSSIDRIQAVKEASADLAFFSACALRAGCDFLSGDDPTYLPTLSVGGVGVISVISNIFPKAVVELTKAFQAGKNARATSLHNLLVPMMEVLMIETNPCPVKAALHSQGLIQNQLRLPLAPVSADHLQKIKSVVENTKQGLKKDFADAY